MFHSEKYDNTKLKSKQRLHRAIHKDDIMLHWTKKYRVHKGGEGGRPAQSVLRVEPYI